MRDPGPPRREEIDRTLADLAAAHDRIAAAMYAVDTHPGLAFLRDTPTTGRTRLVGEDARRRIDALWTQFADLRVRLDALRSLRAQRSRPSAADLAAIAALLREPVPAPDGSPDLSGPIALAAHMTAGCAEVTALLDGMVSAGAGLATLMAAPVDALAEIERRAGAGEDPGTDAAVVAAARADLARISERAFGDPLGAAAEAAGGGLDGEVRRLTADLAAVRARLDEVARVRAELPARLAALERAVAGLADAERRTADSYATARAKIADPGLPPAPAAAAGLAERLRGLTADAAGLAASGASDVAAGAGPAGAGPAGGAAAAGAGGWVRLVDRLVALEDAVAEAASWSVRLAEAADGLLERRAELRGRLEAYRAKAARLGYAEHPGLHPHQVRARDLLYSSPCDLPAATRAVLGYQQALAALTSARPDREVGR